MSMDILFCQNTLKEKMLFLTLVLCRMDTIFFLSFLEHKDVLGRL